MLRAAVDTFDGPEGARGCLLVLGAPTRTRTNAPIHDRLHALRCNSPELLRRRLERAVADREIPAGVDLDNIAAFYTAVGHGLAISARDGAQKHMLLAIVAPVGIAQDAVAVALENSHASIGAYADELEAWRDVVMRQLDGLPFGVPDGGWSLLLHRLAITSALFSRMSRRGDSERWVSECAAPSTGSKALGRGLPR